MVRLPRNSNAPRQGNGRVASLAAAVPGALGLMLSLLMTASATAQPGEVHYRQQANMPPGAIGQAQLERGGPLRGYTQPVQILAPPGAKIALAAGPDYQQPLPAPVSVGMQIGMVYRFQVSAIPQQPGLEVYPTIEVINRLYPPPGHKARFPIPVELTQRELELALAGRFVTRVIYLEDPRSALPVAETPGEQRVFEVAPGQDPLQVADVLGRPMAILRMGSRVPEPQEFTSNFQYGSPPTRIYPPPANLPAPAALQPTAPGTPPVVDRPREVLPPPQEPIPNTGFRQRDPAQLPLVRRVEHLLWGNERR